MSRSKTRGSVRGGGGVCVNAQRRSLPCLDAYVMHAKASLATREASRLPAVDGVRGVCSRYTCVRGEGASGRCEKMLFASQI